VPGFAGSASSLPCGTVTATLIALLRGVNVGGKNLLPMADLRDLVAALGHRDVRTYIQSGNLVFTPAPRSTRSDAVAGDLSGAIARRFGLDVVVVVRTPEELADAAAAHPFVLEEPDAAKLHLAFLSARPTAEAAARLETDRFQPDRFVVQDRRIALHYPSGMGRSKMTVGYFERRLGVSATVRNLTTVAKLVDLAARP